MFYLMMLCYCLAIGAILSPLILLPQEQQLPAPVVSSDAAKLEQEQEDLLLYYLAEESRFAAGKLDQKSWLVLQNQLQDHFVTLARRIDHINYENQQSI
jgi:hypothetical protein